MLVHCSRPVSSRTRHRLLKLPLSIPAPSSLSLPSLWLIAHRPRSRVGFTVSLGSLASPKGAGVSIIWIMFRVCLVQSRKRSLDVREVAISRITCLEKKGDQWAFKNNVLMVLVLTHPVVRVAGFLRTGCSRRCGGVRVGARGMLTGISKASRWTVCSKRS